MKIEKKHIVILCIVLLILLIAGTYAYFVLLVSNDEDSTKLNTGTLKGEYSQGKIIKESFYPRNEPSLDDLTYVYSNEFTFTNTGTLDGLMEVKLSIDSNEFSDKAIKYSLYNSDGNKIATGDIPKEGTVSFISNVLMKSGASANYTLLLWLEETGVQQNNEEAKVLTATIGAEFVQYVE